MPEVTTTQLDEALRQRVLARDGRRCWAARWLGGDCSSTLDVHHLIPRAEGGLDVEDNLITVCHDHHPVMERLRRAVLNCRGPRWRTCRHTHPYPGGREECERKMNREAA